MGLAGTLAQNGHFFPTMRTELRQSSVRPTRLQRRAAALSPKYWEGWGGISPEFDEIETGTSLYVSAVARDGVVHQGLEYETPFSWAEDWGPNTPFRPRREHRRSGASRQTHAEQLQTQWERERLERQREKERLGEIEWAAARREEIAEQERKRLAERKVTRQQLESGLGMSIAQAKSRFTPGPMLVNGNPNMEKWEYGIHAHPSLWLWED